MLIAVLASLALANCSCAMYHKSWKAENPGGISNSSFHHAAKEAGFKAHHTSMMGYRNRDVYFSYTDDQRINLYSVFCPSPLTLLAWGADADAWHDRCERAEKSILELYSKSGMKLQEVSEAEESTPRYR